MNVRIKLIVAIAATAIAQICSAAVNLELRQIPSRSGTCAIGVYAVHDGNGTNLIASTGVIVNWDASKLSLTGATTPAIWWFSAFTDPYGINTTWSDGDAMWAAGSMPWAPVQATMQGTLMTTLNFSVVQSGTSTISIPATAGNGGFTVVWGGDYQGHNVTGTLGSVEVTR